jgi:hypothetical protein
MKYDFTLRIVAFRRGPKMAKVAKRARALDAAAPGLGTHNGLFVLADGSSLACAKHSPRSLRVLTPSWIAPANTVSSGLQDGTGDECFKTTTGITINSRLDAMGHTAGVSTETDRVRRHVVTLMPHTNDSPGPVSEQAGSEQEGDASLAACQASVLKWLPPAEEGEGDEVSEKETARLSIRRMLAWLPP